MTFTKTKITARSFTKKKKEKKKITSNHTGAMQEFHLQKKTKDKKIVQHHNLAIWFAFKLIKATNW